MTYEEKLDSFLKCFGYELTEYQKKVLSITTNKPQLIIPRHRCK